MENNTSIKTHQLLITVIYIVQWIDWLLRHCPGEANVDVYLLKQNKHFWYLLNLMLPLVTVDVECLWNRCKMQKWWQRLLVVFFQGWG